MTSNISFGQLYIELSAGGIAGVVSQVANHPVDTVKTIYQGNINMTYSKICKDIYKVGILNFWKGCMVPAFSFGIVNSFSFGSYYFPKKYLDPNMESTMISIYCGTFSSFVQLVPWVPSELIKIHMQMAANKPYSKNITVVSSVKEIYNQYGAKGFYHGALIQLMRDIPNSIVYYITYEKLNNYLDKQYNLHLVEKSIISGGLTGMLSWIIVIPLDLMKTRIQSRMDKDIMSSYRYFRSNGLSSFFRGSILLIVRSFSLNAMIFLVYESILPTFESLF